jgi:hypothetical protein
MASGRSGPLDRDLWDPGRWGPMGTHVSQASGSTCRQSGRDEVTSVRSEDVVSIKSHRVHGDPKKKVLLGAYEGEHQVSRE